VNGAMPSRFPCANRVLGRGCICYSSNFILQFRAYPSHVPVYYLLFKRYIAHEYLSRWIQLAHLGRCYARCPSLLQRCSR
jgi:hypothetical protein